MTEPVDWIAIDWGTSNVRAWTMSPENAIIANTQSDKGMGRLEPQQYPSVLDELIADLPPLTKSTTDIVVCGMAGAKQGWCEAPYIKTPASLATLGQNAVTPPGLDNTKYNARILSGICHNVLGQEDVIRGEETQLLGYLSENPDFNGVVCMPGTHSKWAQLDNSRVEKFTTAMTGELFEILSEHSVLRHSLADTAADTDQTNGLNAGLSTGIDAPDKLTGNLFKVRAAALLADRSPNWCKGYLSGLLIGAEVAGHKDWIGTQSVPLIGSDKLCAIYAQALKMIGASGFAIDTTKATLAGLTAAREQIV